MEVCMEIWPKDTDSKNLIHDKKSRDIIRKLVWNRIGNASVASIEKVPDRSVFKVEVANSHFYVDKKLKFTLLSLQ